MNATEAKEKKMASLEIGLVLAGVRPVVTDIYGGIKSFFSNKYKEYTAAKLSSRLNARATDISQVKTLLCLEQPVLITDFYSPQFLITPSGERVEVTSPEILDEYSRMVVVGVAGQGKSILFRFLALHELARKRLPLFVELRNFEQTPSIRQLLLNEIEVLGLPSDEPVLDYLLEQGKCTLYLDAFDEIPPLLQSDARKQIEDISRKHLPSRVYVSSRPTLNIESSAQFRVARLDNLRPDEAIAALVNMCDERDEPEKMKNELSKPGHQLTGLLTTPLMVALLVLHHRLSKEFPKTEQAFFGDLFDVLLRRHDQTKGYSRTRNSNASEVELLELFGYVSFACRRNSIIELPRAGFVDICHKGSQFHGRSFDPGGALDNIVLGTNLILEEGGSYRYAHKAIQEFYAARFLSSQPEDDVARFLSNRIDNWANWLQLLEFTELLNPFLFYKHFLLPHASKVALGDPQRGLPAVGWIPGKDVYLRVYGGDAIGIVNGQLMMWGPSHCSQFYPLREKQSFPIAFRELIAKVAWEEIPEDPTVDVDSPFWVRDAEKRYFHFTLKHLLEQPACADSIRDALKPHILEAIEIVRQSSNLVAYRSEQDDFFA